MSSQPMVTCKDCKHWEKNSYWCKHPSLGKCKSGKFKYFCTQSLVEVTDDQEVEYGKVEKDAVFYYDCEGYKAFLETGEDFGCIHGEHYKCQ